MSGLDISCQCSHFALRLELRELGNQQMERISERGQAERKGIAPAANDKRNQWIILGAGRLGRAFLNLVADEQGFKSLLLVEGVNTPQSSVDEFNHYKESGDGYSVLMIPTLARVSLRNYDFMTAIDTGLIIQQIANPSTQVISTSVGLNQLSKIAPILAKGLKLRAERTLDRLLILVCENGRSVDGTEPAQILRVELEKWWPSVLQTD